MQSRLFHSSPGRRLWIQPKVGEDLLNRRPAPSAAPTAASRLGEHACEILRELGRSEIEIDQLYASGAAS